MIFPLKNMSCKMWSQIRKEQWLLEGFCFLPIAVATSVILGESAAFSNGLLKSPYEIAMSPSHILNNGQRLKEYRCCAVPIFMGLRPQ